MIKAIADRPWIWFIVFFVTMLCLMIGFVVIAEKYGPREIPIPHAQSDY